MSKSYKNILTILILSLFFFGCSKAHVEKEKYVIVKIPPAYDKSLSSEENFYRFKHFLYPQTPIPNPIPKGLPNYDGLLSVILEEDGQIKLNTELNGNIQNTNPLIQRLKGIFQDRKEYGVFEVNSNKVVKAVGIDAPHSAKFGDVMKVINAVDESKAEPMVLMIDGNPLNAIFENMNVEDIQNNDTEN